MKKRTDARINRLHATLLAIITCCAFFLGGCQWLAPSGAASSGGIIISEVVSSNTRSLVHEVLGTPDWIELYNAGTTSVNLAGCHLSDNIREPRKWEFPSVSIGPGEYLIIYATKYEGDLPNGVYCTGFNLSKSGESLYFTDRYLGILDSVDIPPLRQDVSYARGENGLFGFCGIPTPGAANTTPIVSDLASVSYAGADADVQLSEVVPVNSSGMPAANGRRYPWAELYNAGQDAVRLLEYWLSDDPQNFSKWQLPDLLLQPGERLIVYFSGNKSENDAEVHAGFRLGSEDEGLYLSNTQGQVVSQLTWELPMVANIAVVQTSAAEKYAAMPTPGAPNSEITFASLLPAETDESDPVILNEVLPVNRYSLADADGERNEWAELYNRSGETVSLGSYAISDDWNDPAKWVLPDIPLAPGEYLVIFLSGKDRREGELHASFGLSRSDEVMLLTNLNGMRQDAIPLDAEITANISMGRGGNGEIVYFATPTPGAPNDSAGFEQLAAVPARNAGGVYISEVSAVSAAKSGKPDWIELHNPTNREISLAGWGLSDDIDQPDKYVIKSLSMPPGGYAVINASSRTSRQTETTAPFGISSSGDTIFLTDEAGILRDYFETGALSLGVSAGRKESDPTGARAFFSSPTPGEANGSASYPGYAAAPVFSQSALYHAEPFSLEISSAEGARVYYTLDGSKPTENAAVYTGPVSISGNTCVRAIAAADGRLNSEIVTRTFLFETPHTLPVICINGNPENFSTVNGASERSQRTEREMYMAYYETDGRLGIDTACGLRATGSSTLTYAQKSFTMYFRGAYGRSSAAYPFYPGYDINEFCSLTIRNSGQDRSNARLRDSYYSLAVEGMYIDNVATRPVIVYINGSYWGIYDLIENQNEDFLASHYGVDPDQVDIIRRNVQALAGSNRDNKRVREFGRGRDLGVQANYEEYAEWVDIDYINDYVIAQTFFANGDMFNQKYWRSHDYTVKWRPVFYDLDYGFFHNNPTRNILGQYFKYEGVPSQDLSITNMDLFCGLPANAGWREQFIKRYIYLVETHLTAERLTTLLDDVAAELRPEMERHIQKWRYPSSLSTWEKNVQDLRDCLEKRPPNALKYVQNYFSVSDAQMEAYRQEVLGGEGNGMP